MSPYVLRTTGLTDAFPPTGVSHIPFAIILIIHIFNIKIRFPYLFSPNSVIESIGAFTASRARFTAASSGAS